MQLPQIQIDQTHAKIGTTSQNAALEIEQPKADLSIDQPQADIRYFRRPSKLTIDQTEAWAAMNVKSVRRSISEFAADGERAWFEGVARVAAQGDQLMQIENGGNPIPAQAAANSEPPIREVNIAFIPPPFSVKFNYDPGDLTIEAQPRKPLINAQLRKPLINVQPGKIETYLSQKNTIAFSVKIDHQY